MNLKSPIPVSSAPDGRKDFPHRARFLPALRATLSLILAFSLFSWDLPTLASPIPAAEKKPKADPALKGLPITDLSVDEAILHALNRLAYGPRPGDLERIKQMGLAKWIDQQLNPNSLEDKALDARLQNFPTLRLNSTKLIAEYPQPKQAAKQSVNPQQPESRAEAAAAVIARDSQADSGSKASAPAMDESSDAPSPMKQAPEN